VGRQRIAGQRGRGGADEASQPRPSFAPEMSLRQSQPPCPARPSAAQARPKQIATAGVPGSRWLDSISTIHRRVVSSSWAAAVVSVSMQCHAHISLPTTPYCRSQYEGPAACRCERLHCCLSVHGLAEPAQVFLPFQPAQVFLPSQPAQVFLPFCQPAPHPAPSCSPSRIVAILACREGTVWLVEMALIRLLCWV
jgi:hypothetical protein